MCSLWTLSFSYKMLLCGKKSVNVTLTSTPIATLESIYILFILQQRHLTHVLSEPIFIPSLKTGRLFCEQFSIFSRSRFG